MYVFGMTQEQIDKMKMEAEESANTIHRIFDEIDPEDLSELRDWLAVVTQDNSLGFYWVGQIDAKLRAHEFVKLTKSNEVMVPDPEMGEAEPKWVQGMLDLDEDEAGTSAENIQKNLDLYGVGIDRQLGKTELGIRCLNCGMRYPSLEDRMKREPGVKGCPGCQNKAAWG